MSWLVLLALAVLEHVISQETKKGTEAIAWSNLAGPKKGTMGTVCQLLPLLPTLPLMTHKQPEQNYRYHLRYVKFEVHDPIWNHDVGNYRGPHSEPG